MFEESSEILRQAINDGMVDTALDYQKKTDIINMMAFLMDHSNGAGDPNTFQLATHPTSQRWTEHWFNPAVHPAVGLPWIIELARVCSAPGELVILRSIEQVLLDAYGSYYPTQISYWGAPYSVHPDLNTVLWWFQIDHYDGLQPPRFQANAAGINRSILTGRPWDVIPTLDAIWYPVHSPTSQVRIIIPQASMLRFYFYSPAMTTGDFRWKTTGRLRWTTQTTFSSASSDVASRS